MIYDLSGREIFNKQKINNTELNIQVVRQALVYVVKIKLDNGQILLKGNLLMVSICKYPILMRLK
jgi:hypothetical protein